MDSLQGGLSHRKLLEVSFGVCRGQGSAVTQVVVGGVVWCEEGSGFADPRQGCHAGRH